MWTAECQQALDALKVEVVVEGKVLRPLWEDLPLLLRTYWSSKGICAVLGQVEPDGHEYMSAVVPGRFTCTKNIMCPFRVTCWVLCGQSRHCSIIYMASPSLW